MPASLVEWIAVALAFAYVLLAIRQSRWCWPAAAASAAIYLVLFARGGLPMQAAQRCYLPLTSTTPKQRPGGCGWSAARMG